MSINITFPDGAVKQVEAPTTGIEIANGISSGLRRNAVAINVNGEQWDLSREITTDVTVDIITRDTEEGLEVLRHDAAHVMAEAVKELYPETQVTIGPSIENGFYYDFARDEAFTPEDLDKIEGRMKEIVKRNETIDREVWDRNEAISYFKSIGEVYKAEIISDLPESETITVYRQGEFLDLCRGPHLPSTGILRDGFKLTKLAGAYWRGDSNNAQLQRIYGTAWSDKKQLKAYLKRMEEAEKRDHRKLGKALDLFHIQDEAPGSVFWHPKGWAVYQAVQQYMGAKQYERGYQEIRTPQVVDISLWEKSGHASKFGDDMFTLSTDDRNYAIKPMNCPCHVQVFNQGLKSYRDLPLRLVEFGSCHRNEPSGSLHGIMRVRSFVQDDGHIFVMEDQLQQEVSAFISLLHEIYKDFGFTDIIYRLSTRPEQRVGSDAVWDKAEQALIDALNSAELDWAELPGEGAFYGPKIEFSLKDAIGRVWQCGTIQVDFSMPGRLGAQFVAEDGSRQAPVMLHGAILGSLERFIGILIEEYEGAFPTWLAPEQVVIMNITDKQVNYCTELAKRFNSNGFRVKTDLRNEKIGFKIREHTLQRIPYLIVVGDKEVESQRVSIRTRKGEELGTMSVMEFEKHLQTDVSQRSYK